MNHFFSDISRDWSTLQLVCLLFGKTLLNSRNFDWRSVRGEYVGETGDQFIAVFDLLQFVSID
ncbi:unannotated protein [freshwater metagenome]|uniref:Unannotated protein n=1 Tax=freshwater metagenome TaxID=449393 RepID=A0A6J6X5L1_9ZZZZ